MFVRIATLATLLAVPAFVGCKDYERDRTAYNAKDEEAKPKGVAPGESTTQYDEKNKPDLRFPSGEIGQPGATGQQGTIGTTANAGNTLATATLSGSANGTATFFTGSNGDIRATINLRGAPVGTYGAYLFADMTCDQVKKMDKLFATSEAETAKELGKDMEKTTEAYDYSKMGSTASNEKWKSLGTVNVGSESAPATSTVDAAVIDRRDLDRHVIAILPIRPSDAKPVIISCGVVKKSEAPERQG